MYGNLTLLEIWPLRLEDIVVVLVETESERRYSCIIQLVLTSSNDNSNGRLALRVTSEAIPRPTMVSDMISSSGKWDWERLEHHLPISALESLAAIQLPKPEYGIDVPGWRWEERRNFWMKSAYKFLMQEGDSLRDSKWRIIWSLRVPQRIRVFMWITSHKRHLTNVERRRRHLSLSDTCSICLNGVEDLDHVLRKCHKVHDLWSSILSPDMLDWFWTTPFDAWLLNNIKRSARPEQPDFDWSMQFSIFCWLLWKNRCRIVFDKKFAMHDSILDSVLLAELWAIYDGLNQAWDAGFQRVVVESDNKEARGWFVKSCHVLREENAAANKLVVLGKGCGMNGSIFVVPPRAVASIVEHDQRRWIEE
ncbi:hypothetical protein GQ457_18G013860 [Hibiscus cannabinus]